MATPPNNFVAMSRCFFCGEGKDILINGRMRDISKYHNKVIDQEPCPKCAEYMKEGVILVSVKDEEESQNPYRTGKFAVVRATCFPPEHTVQRTRFAYVTDTMWTKMGLDQKTEPA